MGDHIFISYSRKDQATVDKIVAILQRSKIPVWQDHEQIQPGTVDWERSIRQGVIAARGVIYAASEDAAKSDYVRDELQIARDNSIPIYPLWITGTRWSDCMPIGYGKIQYADGRSDLDIGVQAILSQVFHGYTLRTAPPETERIRRLPVYLLLDCSASMAGEPIKALSLGVSHFCNGMVHDLPEQAVQTIWVSVITFGDTAVQYPLCPVCQFQQPVLEGRGARATGAALRLLADSIEHDLVRDPSRHRGDFCPIVFLITDGEPTDYIDEQVSRLKSLPDNLEPNIFAIGAGEEAPLTTFRQITYNILMMGDMSPSHMLQLLRWID